MAKIPKNVGSDWRQAYDKLYGAQKGHRSIDNFAKLLKRRYIRFLDLCNFYGVTNIVDLDVTPNSSIELIFTFARKLNDKHCYNFIYNYVKKHKYTSNPPKFDEMIRKLKIFYDILHYIPDELIE